MLETGSALLALDHFLAASELLTDPSDLRVKREALAGAASACAVRRSRRPPGAIRRRAADVLRGLGYAGPGGGPSVPVARLQVVQGDLLAGEAAPERSPCSGKALEVFRQTADDSGMESSAARLGTLLEDDLPGEAVEFLREAAEAASARGGTRTWGITFSRSRGGSTIRLEAREPQEPERSPLGGMAPLTLEASDKLSSQRDTSQCRRIGRRRPGGLRASAGGGSLARERAGGRLRQWLSLGRADRAREAALESLPRGELPRRALLAACWKRSTGPAGPRR